MNQRRLRLLYTDIGRGHPFYLDGIIEELNRSGAIKLIRGKSDVFAESGDVSGILWKLVRYLYHQGAQDSVISKIYRILRKNSNYNKKTILQYILGKDIRKKYMYDSDPVIVAHPLLVSLLKGRSGLFYQHGELITPDEAVVKGAETVFVPVASAAEPFYKYYNQSKIFVTGLCIEPSLVKIASDCYRERQTRISESKYLRGGFISSGAEPKRHLEILIHAIISLAYSNHSSIAFTKTGGRFEQQLKKELIVREIPFQTISPSCQIPYELPQVLIIQFNNRREEYIQSSRFFKYLDYLMSPSHERTNWTIGLGLPMFITDPSIGPFSPLNRDLIIESETGLPISDVKTAIGFNELLSDLHWKGTLSQMASNGWNKEKIDGFKAIGRFFSNYLTKEAL